jgi:hypothetical protein
MATPPTVAEGADARQNLADSYREIVANAFAFVEGQKTTQTFAAITPEDLYDQFINRVSGPDTQARPNALNRIAKIKNDMASAISKIKALPDGAFRTYDNTQDVNTNPNGT